VNSVLDAELNTARLAVIAILAHTLPAAVAAQQDYYPLHVGARWTYESSFRGTFTNTVTDTVRIEGLLWHRVESTDEHGSTQVLHMRRDGGLVHQRIGTGRDFRFMDFDVPVGGSFTVEQGPSSISVTHVAQHDTLTVLGTPFHDVREYRHVMPDGQSWTAYYVRGIGQVALDWPRAGQQARLVRAQVGGATFTASATEEHRSGVTTQPLTPARVEDVALLGTVWGFAKYHHPAVANGDIDWDAELFRVLPLVLDAGGTRAADGPGASAADAAAATIDGWLAELGDPPPCAPCATLDADVHPEPDNGWIERVTHDGLRARLERIHHNRSTADTQRYVSHAPGVGNPVFAGEEPYAYMSSPDAGFRMLALFRYWNIIRYWFPYRDLIDDDWDDVLREFVPVMMAAADADAYRLALLRLVARIHDTHATLHRALPLRPPTGTAQLPVVLRFIEDHAVVTGYSHAELGPATGLQPGDALLRIDDAAVDSLVAAWTPYYPASNQPARLHDMAPTLTRGGPGPVRLTVLRDGARTEITAQRAPLSALNLNIGRTHDLGGEAFRMLDDDVAYLRMSGMDNARVPEWFDSAANARVLVIDIRNYPSQFGVFSIGGRLVTEPTPFARFTTGDIRNPGAFRWTEPVMLRPVAPHYERTVVVLVDESSISQAEYTAMALRAGVNTIIVGSTTAGADGNVSTIQLPGGLTTLITGIGVFYPDRTPTQRIGIIPDLVVRPTIAGIRAGRDEVLEAGVSRALGRAWRH
jgi:C-terminal processing protease CtpA/Prc